MKKLLTFVFMLVVVSAAFAQSYQEHLAAAKNYESQKRWCYALGSYYDAMATDEAPGNKLEALERYNTLKDAIESGNPGLGEYNQFLLHDEWKKLLIDAEKYGSNSSKYDISIGDLKQGNLDYETRTASYTAEIKYNVGKRYEYTIGVVVAGYDKAFKDDWSDLPKPENWPKYSVSYNNDGVYNVDGARVVSFIDDSSRYKYIDHYNAFEGCFCILNYIGFIKYEFIIIDENGNNIANKAECYIDDVIDVRRDYKNDAKSMVITFTDISPEGMQLIDAGKAFVKPVGCSLKCGEFKFSSFAYIADRRLFGDEEKVYSYRNNLPEVKIPMEKVAFVSAKNPDDKKYENVVSVYLENIKNQVKPYLDSAFVEIPSKNYLMQKTEMPQSIYEIVMNENSSYKKGDNMPMTNVSFCEVVYFCNMLSKIAGYEPVYSINGIADVKKWKVFMNSGSMRSVDFAYDVSVTANFNANGYRLPTKEEWLFSAKGGQKKYMKFNDLDNFVWYNTNAGGDIHPVAQKMANEYGLYDMFGNVWELIDNRSDVGIVSVVGGAADATFETFGSNNYMVCMGRDPIFPPVEKTYFSNSDKDIGFRIVRNAN